MSEQDGAQKEDRTPGIISWNELITKDPEGSVKFYTELFGWTTEEMPMPGGSYVMLKAGEKYVAGLTSPPPDKEDAPNAWVSYVTVEDLDASVAKAQELGAHLCVGPMEVPDKGRFAGIADPQGAMIAMWEFAEESCT